MSTMSRSSARDRPARDGGVRGIRRALGGRCSTAARPAGRPARVRASRTTSAFRPASPARRSPGRAFVQAQKFGAHIAIPVRGQGAALRPQRRSRSNSPTAARARAHGRDRERRGVPAPGDRRARPLRGRAASITGRRRSRRSCCKEPEVVLVGGGNSAGQGASSGVASRACARADPRRGPRSSMSRYLIDRIAALPNVTLHTRTEIASLDGDDRGLTRGELRDARRALEFECAASVSLHRRRPNTGWLATAM